MADQRDFPLGALLILGVLLVVFLLGFLNDQTGTSPARRPRAARAADGDVAPAPGASEDDGEDASPRRRRHDRGPSARDGDGDPDGRDRGAP